MLQALRIRGYDAEDGRGLADAVTLVVDEKERLILEDRAAHCTAKLVLAVLALLDRIEEVTRIEVVVAQELEGRTVKLVGTGLRRNENCAPTSAAVLRRVVEREDVEFLDRVDLWQKRDSTAGQFVIVDTIKAPVICILRHALDRQ